ncbi:dihydroorotase [Tistlia consotensis]|uniref:Dihydroorotase n=1 Tax=Tistlia consotensis USBA 355 TaxID=560819 RepID=A0A1Y6CCZ7_9PROT|nr:dihydroorotase [Tistlia consotensis]SMF48077.1 dihydroorotase [Tistlia consotensis USBA 355]SNR81895.1 dihydroorotase [Tistlia consotensis]
MQRPPARPVAPGRVAYVNARLLDPASGLDAPGALLTEGAEIADRGPELFKDGVPEGIETVDCGGACLAPGLVDMRVQLREPGEEHKETISTASRAAAIGGVTSMVALPNTEPIVDDVAGVEFVARRAREEKSVKVYTYGAVTRGLEGHELTEMGLLTAYGALGFTDGLKAVADAQVMRRALAYSTIFDTVILQHPEEPSLARGVMNSGALATRLGLSGIPVQAEVIMVERDLRLVEMTGGRYHVSHVSTGAAIEAIRGAKKRGLPVSCDTAPHYFTLNENSVGDYRTFAKVSPPLRSEDDRKAVAEGLADGTIDAIASDHAPQDQDAKRLPFALAEPGIVGLETLLALSLAPVHAGRMGLLELLACLTSRPAAILKGRSGLTRGWPADLVVFDAEKPWTIDPDRFTSKSKNAPFEGHMVQGRVLRTVVDGRPIFVA